MRSLPNNLRSFPFIPNLVVILPFLALYALMGDAFYGLGMLSLLGPVAFIVCKGAIQLTFINFMGIMIFAVITLYLSLCYPIHKKKWTIALSILGTALWMSSGFLAIFGQL